MDLELTSSQEEVIPAHFYGWQCVSLKLPMRTIDFVFHDDDEIMNFLQTMNHLISCKSRYADSLVHKTSLGQVDDPY